jgi:hypothetical protein
MIPEEIYKRRRRHNNTPQYALLIIANFVTCCALFSLNPNINWFFFAVIAGLAVYNYFIIRRHIHEFTRQVVIAYAVSLVGILILFFATR